MFMNSGFMNTNQTLINQRCDSFAIEPNGFLVGGSKLATYLFLGDTGDLRQLGVFCEDAAGERVVKHEVEGGSEVVRRQLASFRRGR